MSETGFHIQVQPDSISIEQSISAEVRILLIDGTPPLPQNAMVSEVEDRSKSLIQTDSILCGSGSDFFAASINDIFPTGGIPGSQKIHLANNYYNSVTGHAVDSDTGFNVLVEGNYLEDLGIFVPKRQASSFNADPDGVPVKMIAECLGGGWEPLAQNLGS
ncbi:hypothetical protein B0H14DRAFT_2571147 [Mycena olivaceomarginata]|nr:hypothetical protein B0H14DRAFT_2571128 [Mycena olivaceomarginata]KAJ7870827.1 hypothetical protein B0H14DRAFT_2571147 [Mycena olivaceomarginata]